MVLPRSAYVPILVTTALALTLSGGVVATTTAKADDTSSPAVATDVSAPDEATAAAMARAQGRAVRVDGETTPTTSISAQPDGTFQYKADTEPVRTERDGAWIDIDESLATDSSGMLAPRAAEVPVRFSPGGSNVLDQVQTGGGQWVTETWPFGNLPTPQVSGSTVTYPEALPGVDVQLAATPSGMSSLLVIKNEQAASDPRLESFRLGVHGATVAPAAQDSMVAKTADGSTVTAGSPLWWDSTDGGDGTGPGGNEPNRPVEHSTDTSGMTLHVTDTVTSADPTYPVFVDPDWNGDTTAAWYTDKAYPNQSYLTAASSNVLRVGNFLDPDSDVYYDSHMFYQFSMGALHGKKIIDAGVSMTQLSVDACPTNAIVLERYGFQSAGFTWNNEPNDWHGSLGSKTPGSCSNPLAAVNVGWSVTSAVDDAKEDSSVQFGLRSASSAQSRRHFSRSASLTVTYDNPPNKPSAQAFGSPTRTCSTSPSAPVVFNGNQPVIVHVTQDDPDGSNVRSVFYYQDITTNTLAFKGTSDPVTAPGTTTMSHNAESFTEGDLYAWRAQGLDPQGATSDFSPYCYFKLDNTKPAAPTIQSYAGATAVGVGTTVVLGQAASDVAGYEYWLDASSAPSASPPVTLSPSAVLPANGSQSKEATFVSVSTSSTTSITVAPTDDTSRVWIVAYDNAGNMSLAVSQSLLQSNKSSVGLQGTSSFHSWKLSSMSWPLPSRIPDTRTVTSAVMTDTTAKKDLVTGSGHALDGRDEVAGIPDVPVLEFDGTTLAGTSVTTDAGPAVNTLQSFSASAWVKPTQAALTGTHAILAQSGTARSGFVLETVSGKLTFCIQPQVGTTSDCIASTTTASPDVWVLVTGIWDSVNRQIRLSIDGVTATPFVAPHSIPQNDASANGAVTVGSAQVGGALANAWNGSITNPRIEQQVLESTELQKMVNLY